MRSAVKDVEHVHTKATAARIDSSSLAIPNDFTKHECLSDPQTGEGTFRERLETTQCWRHWAVYEGERLPPLASASLQSVSETRGLIAASCTICEARSSTARRCGRVSPDNRSEINARSENVKDRK